MSGDVVNYNHVLRHELAIRFMQTILDDRIYSQAASRSESNERV